MEPWWEGRSARSCGPSARKKRGRRAPWRRREKVFALWLQLLTPSREYSRGRKTQGLRHGGDGKTRLVYKRGLLRTSDPGSPTATACRYPGGHSYLSK